MRSTVIGLYDDHAVAETVYQKLADLGIAHDDLHMVSHQRTDLSSWRSDADNWERGHFGHEIVDRLTSLNFSRQDAELYCEGVRRGGTLVVAEVDDPNVERAADIMNLHRPVNLRSRLEHWRNLGYTGYDESTTPLTEEEIRDERNYLSREHTPLVEDRVVQIGRSKYL